MWCVYAGARDFVHGHSITRLSPTTSALWISTASSRFARLAAWRSNDTLLGMPTTPQIPEAPTRPQGSPCVLSDPVRSLLVADRGVSSLGFSMGPNYEAFASVRRGRSRCRICRRHVVGRGREIVLDLFLEWPMMLGCATGCSAPDSWCEWWSAVRLLACAFCARASSLHCVSPPSGCRPQSGWLLEGSTTSISRASASFGELLGAFPEPRTASARLRTPMLTA